MQQRMLCPRLDLHRPDHDEKQGPLHQVYNSSQVKFADIFLIF
jgi:hypothetical protein